LVCVK